MGPTGGDLELPEVPEVPHRDEVEQLAEAARQQRRAVEAIRPLRASQFGFWVASMRQLAEDETELGAQAGAGHRPPCLCYAALAHPNVRCPKRLRTL